MSKVSEAAKALAKRCLEGADSVDWVEMRGEDYQELITDIFKDGARFLLEEARKNSKELFGVDGPFPGQMQKQTMLKLSDLEKLFEEPSK